jgi:hypothetical protein
LIVEKLAQERQRIDRALQDLHRTGQVLDGIIASAGGQVPKQ